MDFGHAPIFPDADVFPCIVVLGKPELDENRGGGSVRVAEFPREVLGKVRIKSYVEKHGHTVPGKRFGKSPWSLEPQAVDDLMHKIQQNGVPLAEFAGVKPYRGILTGLNEAFLIDTPTRDRLVREDPCSAEILKPYLRDQDIKRWSPEWSGLWMIFARRGIDIDAYPAIKRYLLQYRERLEPRPKDWSDGTWPGRKPGPYKWYEIQDSIDYWKLFEQPKILYPDITWRSSFCLDTQRRVSISLLQPAHFTATTVRVGMVVVGVQNPLEKWPLGRAENGHPADAPLPIAQLRFRAQCWSGVTTPFLRSG